MSSLMVVALAIAAVRPCAGAEAEVPVYLEGWAQDDAAWLEQELVGWVSAHERQLCKGGLEPGLHLELQGEEVRIAFDVGGVRRTRTALAAGDASKDFFRYQVAALAEELVRSTWEEPPPPRFELLLRAEVAPLASGPLLAGGSVGAGLFVLPTLGVELSGGGAALPERALSSGGTVSGHLLSGALSVSWLPLRAGRLRAGPRASLQAGALSLRVSESGATTASATTPWLAVGVAVVVGLETRHLAVQVVGGASWALLGASVLAEGVPVQSVRGLMGNFAVQVGWLW